MARPTKPGKQPGVAYLAVLILIAGMGTALALAGTLWHQAQQRAKEQELLFVGSQYLLAIRSYYHSSPGDKGYPPNLDALLMDQRMVTIKRHLRRPYRDPLTNLVTWGVIKAPEGGIMGIYSLAPGQPIKRANFPPELGWAGGKSSYGDWQFTYLPPSGKLGFGQR
jgi:type II secretory pathway pseudopilin PulG